MQPSQPSAHAITSTTSAPTLDFPSFQSTAKQVTSYGATALARWDKKDYNQKRKRELGYLPDPSLKTPLKALQGMNAKNVERREKAAVRARESGLKVKSKRKREAARSRGEGGGGAGRGCWY